MNGRMKVLLTAKVCDIFVDFDADNGWIVRHIYCLYWLRKASLNHGSLSSLREQQQPWKVMCRTSWTEICAYPQELFTSKRVRQTDSIWKRTMGYLWSIPGFFGRFSRITASNCYSGLGQSANSTYNFIGQRLPWDRRVMYKHLWERMECLRDAWRVPSPSGNIEGGAGEVGADDVATH